MPQFFLLGAQITDIAGMRFDFERNARDHHAVASEAVNLMRIVGEQAHLADTEVADNLRADAVIAQVLLESQFQVRLDGIETGVLQRIRPDFVAEPDSASLLMKVDDHARIRREDSIDGLRELLAAVAS